MIAQVDQNMIVRDRIKGTNIRQNGLPAHEPQPYQVVCMGHRGRKTRAKDETRIMRIETAFLFDLDGTLVDSVHHDTRYVYLIDRKTAEEVTFVTDSDGGRRAVGDLSNRIALVRVAHPGAAPIVELVAGPWPTRYGMKSKR
jgi:hypothetical protein